MNFVKQFVWKFEKRTALDFATSFVMHFVYSSMFGLKLRFELGSAMKIELSSCWLFLKKMGFATSSETRFWSGSDLNSLKHSVMSWAMNSGSKFLTEIDSKFAFLSASGFDSMFGTH